MSVNFQISKTVNFGGLSFTESRTLTGGEAILRDISIPAATAGTVAAAMTSTTSTTTTLPPGGTQFGTLSLNSVAGLSIGNRLDVYWSGGSLYGATIEDIAGTSIAFSGGTVWTGGSSYPGNGTAVQVMVPTILPFVFTGNQLQGIAFYSAVGGTFIADTATPTEAYVVVLPNSGSASTSGTEKHWAIGDNIANPLSGIAVTQLFLSHGNTSAAQTMRAGALINP